MGSTFQLALVLTTSLAAYVIGTKHAKLNAALLGRTVEVLLECIGAGIAFLLSNLIIGVSFALIVRSSSLGFVSLYSVGDMNVVFFSFMQGFIFQIWRRLNYGVDR